MIKLPPDTNKTVEEAAEVETIFQTDLEKGHFTEMVVSAAQAVLVLAFQLVEKELEIQSHVLGSDLGHRFFFQEPEKRILNVIAWLDFVSCRTIFPFVEEVETAQGPGGDHL